MKSAENRDLFPGALEMMILQILKRSPMHGYALAKHIKQSSDCLLQIEEGSLYPALHRMEEAGWIRAEWITREAGRRARVYELTREGTQRLEVEESRWRAVTAAVNRVLRMA